MRRAVSWSFKNLRREHQSGTCDKFGAAATKRSHRNVRPASAASTSARTDDRKKARLARQVTDAQSIEDIRRREALGTARPHRRYCWGGSLSWLGASARSSLRPHRAGRRRHRRDKDENRIARANALRKRRQHSANRHRGIKAAQPGVESTSIRARPRLGCDERDSWNPEAFRTGAKAHARFLRQELK